MSSFRSRVVAPIASILALSVFGAICSQSSVHSNRALASLAQRPSSYSLVATWSIPDEPLTWPGRPVGLGLAPYLGEILVVDQSPARVMVMARDGGTLRSIGGSRLKQPQDAAVVHPIDAAGFLITEPERARVFVTEPDEGRVEIFSATGQHVRSVDGLGQPWGVAASHGHVFVTDASGGRVIILDYDGGIVGLWPEPDAVPLAEPGPILAIEEPGPFARHWVVVGERASRSVSWWTRQGELQNREVVLAESSAAVPLDIAAMAMDTTTSLLVATDRGLVRMGWQERPVDIVPAEEDGLIPPISALAAFRTDASQWWVGGDVVTVWAAASASNPVPLHRYFIRHRGTSVEAFRGCPWADEDPARVWRLASSGDARVMVGLTNGVVMGVDRNGSPSRRVEIGDHDDIALDDTGLLWVSARGGVFQLDSDNLTSHSASGLPNLNTLWANEYDCTPAGYGLPLSVSAAEDGRWAEGMASGGGWPFHPAYLAFTADTQRWCRSTASTEPECRSRARRWWYSYQGQVGEPEHVYWLTDLVEDTVRKRLIGVDRWNGRLVAASTDSDGMSSETGLSSWFHPGRPDRAALGPEGHLFVLTAEGIIWELNAKGERITGWDAAGAPNDFRARLVDIAVDRSSEPHRVLAADMVGQRILVFEPRESDAPLPELPPPCTVTVDKNASPETVRVGQTLTVTLELRGTCGRTESRNDVLLVLPLEHDPWSTENRRQAADVLLSAIDGRRDRVGVMLLHGSGRVLAPLSHDLDAARAALRAIDEGQVDLPDPRSEQPLDLARRYLAQALRPEASGVLIVAAGATGQPETFLAAERLRRAGLRTLVVADALEQGFVAASMAFEMEDAYFAPDAETLREVYGRIGSQISAPFLLREMTVTDLVPDNMTVITRTLQPPALWDAGSRSLTWRSERVSFGGWQARVQVVPKEAGWWPTNVAARVDFVDGLGQTGAASFPVPYVQVLDAPGLTQTPQTPTVTATTIIPATDEPSPTAIATRTPTPSRSVWLPIVSRSHCTESAGSADVVVLMDASTSMNDRAAADLSTKLEVAKGAVSLFLDDLLVDQNTDQVALIQFNDRAQILQTLTDNPLLLRSALDRIRTAPQSRLQAGLIAAQAEVLGVRHRPNHRPVVLLLTDGQSNPEPISEAEVVAAHAKAQGIRIFSVGLGDHVETEALRRIASRPEDHIPVAKVAELVRILPILADRIVCPAN